MDTRNEQILSWVKSGCTIRQIADRLDMTRSEACRAMALASIPIPEPTKQTRYRTTVTNVVELFRLWHDSDLSVPDIANRLDVTERAVRRAARRYGLPKRNGFDEHSEPVDVPAGEDEASQSSLRLAPSTERLAAPIRESWSDEVRYQRRVQRVQPLSYDRLGLGS